MYYTLEASAEPKTNGCYPQIKLADYTKEEFIHGLSLDELWDEKIKLDSFKFDDNFIDTDFCTISHFNVTSGIIISEQVKDTLEQVIHEGYKLTPHKFFPVLIPSTKTSKRYYFLQILKSKNVIDYSKSIFENQITDEELSIKDHGEYHDELYPLEIHTVKGFDLFKHPYDGEIFISERLRDVIELNNFTGHKGLPVFDGVYELH